MRMPPNLPSRKKAEAGGTRPSLASRTVMGRSKASAERPRVVARVKGMQNLQYSGSMLQAKLVAVSCRLLNSCKQLRVFEA